MIKLTPIIFVLLTFSCNQREGERPLKPSDLALSYGAKFDKLLLGVESPNNQFVLTQELRVEGYGITLPVGTTLHKAENNPTTFTYDLPVGYKLIGQSADGKARVAAGGSITCTCTAGKGCSPYIAQLGSKESIGCAMSGNCTQCSMKRSGGRVENIDEILSEAEIVNFNQPIHFITTKQELSTTVSPSRTLMQLDAVRQQIVSFAKAYQLSDLDALEKSTGPEDLPSTYNYIHVNVYGRVILLPVQTDLVISANPLVNEIMRDATDAKGRIAARVYKCKCNTKSSGCSQNTGSLLFAKAVWCDAGSCESCTLSWL
ncbi:hypothetical protein [Spirosoma montaniterrae]|uniref:Uncharacterized protein n=1 Tax=Spirosoma montaniterrae TaxID=1178516 RepID=A0A1P9WRD2_9BACT|nr:hypothetical protein [Spirosoma montaniterrae]AQG77919.1 hypothetical protein AWR27_00245 [Spirosoma montaniterrae]